MPLPPQASKHVSLKLIEKKGAIVYQFHAFSCTGVGTTVADFNLMPVPKVLLVQVGIFLANTFVVKKLLLDPYCKLQEHRQSLTQQRQKSSSHELQELNDQWEALQTQRQEKLAELEQHRRQRQAEDVQQRSQALRGAKTKAEKIIRAEKKQIDDEYKRACAASNTAVDYLSSQLLTKLLKESGV